MDNKQNYYSLDNLKSKVCETTDFNSAPTVTGNGKERRTFESVSEVFDCNKGILYSLYNQALYHDNYFDGKIVLELTISAEGHVTNLLIVSTELDNNEFEHNLAELVKSFSFPRASVDPLIITYPIEFH
jgi:hypothetical protein